MPAVEGIEFVDAVTQESRVVIGPKTAGNARFYRNGISERKCGYSLDGRLDARRIRWQTGDLSKVTQRGADHGRTTGAVQR